MRRVFLGSAALLLLATFLIGIPSRSQKPLVVIAIIALLAALIFPVFFRAREQGRKVTCSSNVRQLAQAWVMYAQDWDECTPGGAYTRFADKYTGRSPDGKRYTALWALLPYIRSEKIFVCPTQLEAGFARVGRALEQTDYRGLVAEGNAPVISATGFPHPAPYGIMATTPNGGRGMKSPLIGITTGYTWHDEPVVELAKRYVDVVVQVGGVPVTLAPTENPNLIAQYVERLDGLIISGGKDIPPSLYGEQAIPETDALPEDRPLFEIALVRRFREMDKPVLGICYGCQLLNVAFGGTLIQNIPSQVGNSIKHRRISSAEPHARHVVTIRNGSRLREILGMSEAEIVSSHHQAVKQPAPDFRVTAEAPDGVIETIELEDARFFVGVQWHPEMDPEAEATRRLMVAFVQSASQNNKR